MVVSASGSYIVNSGWYNNNDRMSDAQIQN